MKTKGLLLITLFYLSNLATYAQKKFSFDFYGQLRTDIFYNSRASQEMIDGLFYMYPLNKQFDAAGEDLNARFSGNFYVLTTRLGLNIKGPNLGKATTFAKIEGDFRGAGSNLYTIRMRHAYFQLNWQSSDLLLGQTWHPLFGEIYPQVVNISTGAPFQPFSRAPQIRFRHTFNGFQAIGALVWQSQFTSIGPDNVRSANYIKNSCIPEIYAGINYRNNHWIAGIGIELYSMMPLTQTKTVVIDNGIVNNKIYKTNQRITTLSYEAYLKYKTEDWFVSAKTILGNNLTQLCMLGGYAVKSIDSETGKQTYAPIKNTSTWINAVYGKTWKPGIFLGYTKNLGTGDAITNNVYGMGTDIKQVAAAGIELSYNLPHWCFGLEYSATAAWYGNLNSSNGKINSTDKVTNHRIVGMASFIF